VCGRIAEDPDRLERGLDLHWRVEAESSIRGHEGEPLPSRSAQIAVGRLAELVRGRPNGPPEVPRRTRDTGGHAAVGNSLGTVERAAKLRGSASRWDAASRFPSLRRSRSERPAR